MKYIITEEQEDLVKLEKNADILYKLLNAFYPENFEYYQTSLDTIYVYENHNKNNLLFFYNLDEKHFFIGGIFMEELFEMTGLPFLNYTDVKTNNREMFDNLIKVFAKRHYDWDVEEVDLRWF